MRISDWSSDVCSSDLAGRITTRTNWRDLVQPERRNIMANIGTFTAEKDGYTGTLRTLTLNVKVKLVPNDKGDNENATDFRVQAASHDIGEAWNKISKAERPYVSVPLYDPSFPATDYAHPPANTAGPHNHPR